MNDRSLMLRRPSRPRPFGGGSGLDDFFGLSPLFRSLDTEMNNRMANIRHSLPSYKRVENGYEYSFNLAGFEQKDISIRIDPKSNVLHVVAETFDENDERSVSYDVMLQNEGVIESGDISTTYKNGMLLISIKENEKSFAFDVPLSSDVEDSAGDNEEDETVRVNTE